MKYESKPYLHAKKPFESCGKGDVSNPSVLAHIYRRW